MPKFYQAINYLQLIYSFGFTEINGKIKTLIVLAADHCKEKIFINCSFSLKVLLKNISDITSL